MCVCWGLVMAFITTLLFGSCSGEANKVNTLADSLNALSYCMRYKDLKESNRLAIEAYKVSEDDELSRVEALNNMGFCAFMQMDFERASELFEQALATGHNEIEHLVSDVGLMKIYQRTSMNKLFYDCRNRALKRMERIREDVELITDEREKSRYRYAVSEFHIVSSIYFYYLQQHQESMDAINAIHEELLAKDTAQWLYYEYMRGSGGMYQAENYERTVEGEFGWLVDCWVQSRTNGYVYFEANALQAMAEMLNVPQNRDILKREDRKGLLRLVNEENLPLDSLPLRYANEALRLFKRYGDLYQISGTYRTLATYYNYSGNPQQALPHMKMALQYVNLHHAKYYHCSDSLDRLYTYVPHAKASTELKWITSGIKTVPEWILRLREQLSRTYAAMGCKQESDYNRNIYLDLLDYTRQDKALESRYVLLQKESRQLNGLLLLVACGFFVLVSVFIAFNRYWRKKNALYASRVKCVFALCRKIMAAVPTRIAAEEDIVEILQDTIREDFQRIFETESLRLELVGNSGGNRQEVLDTPQEVFSLILPGINKEVGRLLLTLKRPLRKDERVLLRLLLPYLAWSLENGQNWVSLEDEKNQVEKERYVHSLHLSENKRQNVLKKACVSVVTGIFPYIDRIINEVEKLNTRFPQFGSETRTNKILYIEELITKINECNEVLSLWIKMRSGALNLTVENFSLNELFGIVAKGKRSFEMKRLNFSVAETDAVVKADKALTLFMINTLTENARKYTSAGGHVSLSADEGDNYVEISVTDDGDGLSEKDVNRILNEKVYDSGSIGMDTAQDTVELQRKKGFGFGLMNCKGIIDKYRKTSGLFSVCEFNIQSTLGKGSRFSFRLPKGTGKLLSIITFGLFLGILSVSCTGHHAEAQVQPHNVSSYDSLLAIANDYANKVYDCNVKGDYSQALVYADTVFSYMNSHYLSYSGKSAPLLKLFDGTEEAAEQQWFAQGFDTDYYILLDVRNEAAVAGLALNDFQLYSYNNTAYTALYKQISKDRSLETYCTQMQQSFNNKMIALGLFFLLVVVGSMAYYMLYVRRMQRYRYNMAQVFEINKAVFSVTNQPTDKSGDDFGASLIGILYSELNELVSIKGLALGVYDESAKRLRCFFYPDGEECNALHQQMQRCFDMQETQEYPGDDWYCRFLSVRNADEVHSVGVLALRKDRWRNRDEDRLLLDWVMDYLSVVIYNVVIRVHRKHTDIELAQDETRRVSFEENALHVQNMVLDNCLSTIKHETIYYPNRIKAIIDGLIAKQGSLSDSEEADKLEAVQELVTYYKGVFSLLTSCALRQLDGKTFRRIAVPVQTLLDGASKYFRKQSRKAAFSLTLKTDSSLKANSAVYGDEVLLAFLFENLINEALRYPQSGELEITCSEADGFVRFDFTDLRRDCYTQEELNELFYPSLKWMCKEGSDVLGTEYLVCKQIIREHDEHAGRRGCRINATALGKGKGFSVWFTIPMVDMPNNERKEN